MNREVTEILSVYIPFELRSVDTETGFYKDKYWKNTKVLDWAKAELSKLDETETDIIVTYKIPKLPKKEKGP